MTRTLCALLVVSTVGACTKAKSPADDAPPVGNASTAPALPRVHLIGSDGQDHAVDVEVVRQEAELERGLMYRKVLAPDAGMLFMMGVEDDHTFWMKNTYIPLDMIFITKDMTVAGISADAEPLTETLRSVGKPSLYVLEVNAGWSKVHTVGAGSKVTFENIR